MKSYGSSLAKGLITVCVIKEIYALQIGFYETYAFKNEMKTALDASYLASSGNSMKIIPAVTVTVFPVLYS